MTYGSGKITVWLPAGKPSIRAQAGCTVYSGSVHGGDPYTAVLKQSGVSHTQPDNWFFNEKQHWKASSACGEILLRANHQGGEATCESQAICAVCGQPYGETLGHDFEDTFTVDITPTCLEEGSMSRHCTRCGAVAGVTVIPATDHV